MTIVEKLQAIKRLSGLSQEKLARELGVSFATLNSWINGRTAPRRKAGEKIEALYLDITGQKPVPLDELAAKKQQVLEKRSHYPDVLKTVLDRPDIYDQFMLALTYHSNRIEGSTLTEPETSAILFQDAVIPNKTLVEHLEVKNHQASLRFLLEQLAGASFAVDINLVLKLHHILMNSIRSDAGCWRSHSVRIVGADVPTANYVKVPQLVAELVNDINKPTDDIISHLAVVHVRFEQIHPFSDGNGRVGRLLMQAMALRENLAPAIIRQEKKRFYLTYLEKAQTTGDTTLLESFICTALLEGFRLLPRE